MLCSVGGSVSHPWPGWGSWEALTCEEVKRSALIWPVRCESADWPAVEVLCLISIKTSLGSRRWRYVPIWVCHCTTVWKPLYLQSRAALRKPVTSDWSVGGRWWRSCTLIRWNNSQSAMMSSRRPRTEWLPEMWVKTTVARLERSDKHKAERSAQTGTQAKLKQRQNEGGRY